MNWYLEVLKKYAVFNGRARRKEYWMFVLFNFIIDSVLGLLERLVGGPGIVALLYSWQYSFRASQFPCGDFTTRIEVGGGCSLSLCRSLGGSSSWYSWCKTASPAKINMVRIQRGQQHSRLTLIRRSSGWAIARPLELQRYPRFLPIILKQDVTVER